MSKSKGAGRPDDTQSVEESSAGMPPESSEGVDLETGEGRKALSRDDLYERLGAVDDPEEEVEAPEEDTPQVDDRQEEPSDDASEEPNTEEPSEQQESDSADDADAGDEQAAPQEDDGDETAKLFGRVPDDEWKKLPKRTKERINALKADRKKHIAEADQLRQRAPIADYGEALLNWADQNGVNDSDMDVLLDIGSKLQQGGEVAMNEALRIARHYGYKGTSEAPKDKPLPDWLQAKVDNLEIDPEVARDIANNIPAEQQEPPQPPPQQQRLSQEQELAAIGRQTLATKQAEAQAKHGASWGTLWPKVQREMLNHKGADPRAWGAIFDSCLAIVLERGKAARPPKQQINQSLPPAGQQRQSVDPETLTGRDRLIAKYTRARPGS